jgi:hypothetical protein
MEEKQTTEIQPAPNPVSPSDMREPTREQKNSAVFGNMAQPQGYGDIPYETVPLPSNGIIYSEDSTLHGRQSLDIRVMTAKEEDILTSRALIKRGTVITELLRSCIMDNVDVQDMIAGDRNAIMVALRITGYGAEYPAEIQCSDCEHTYENRFNLSRLPLKRLNGIEPIKSGSNIFSFTLPISGQEVYFKFLTGKDEEEISIIQDKMKKIGNVRDTFVTTRLKYCILQIGDVKDKAKVSRMVDQMRAGDSRALRRHMDKHEPGIIMKQEASCPACGNAEEVAMPLGAQFFWPD